MINRISNYRSVIYITIATISIISIIVLHGCEYEPEGEYNAPVSPPACPESSLELTPGVDTIDVLSAEEWVYLSLSDLKGNIGIVKVQIDELTPNTYGFHPDSTFEIRLKIADLAQGYHSLNIYAEIPVQSQSLGGKLIGESWYVHYSWVLNVVVEPEIPEFTFWGFKDGKPVLEWSKWKYNRFSSYSLSCYDCPEIHDIDSTSFYFKGYNGSGPFFELRTFVASGNGFKAQRISFPDFEVPCQVSGTGDDFCFNWEVPPYYKNLAGYEIKNTTPGYELLSIDNVFQTSYNYTDALFGKVYNFKFTTINKYTSYHSQPIELPQISLGEYTPSFSQFLTSSTCFCSIYKDSIRCNNIQNNTLLGSRKMGGYIEYSGISFNGSNIIAIANYKVYLIDGPGLSSIHAASYTSFGFSEPKRCDVNDQKIAVFCENQKIIVYDFNTSSYVTGSFNIPVGQVILNNKNWFIIGHTIYKFIDQHINISATLPNTFVLDFLPENDDYLVTLSDNKISIIDITNLMVINEIPFNYDKFYSFDQVSGRILFSKDGYLKTISIHDGSIEGALQFYDSPDVSYRIAGNYIHSTVKTCKKYK